jgi:hypothetical protein
LRLLLADAVKYTWKEWFAVVVPFQKRDASNSSELALRKWRYSILIITYDHHKCLSKKNTEEKYIFWSKPPDLIHQSLKNPLCIRPAFLALEVKIVENCHKAF